MIKSAYGKNGKTLKYFTPVIIQGEPVVKHVSTFKKEIADKLKKGKCNKIINSTCHETYGHELKNDCTIMDTFFVLSEEEQRAIEVFTNPKTYTLIEASSLPNGTRMSLAPVQVKSVGEITVVSNGSQRREVQLAMGGRTALLTLWGKEAEEKAEVGAVYTIKCIQPSNDFNNQRCYGSTNMTTFEIYTSVQEKEPFEGFVESVSFESKLIEVGGHILSVTNAQLDKIFPTREYSPVTVEGRKCQTEVCEIDLKRIKAD